MWKRVVTPAIVVSILWIAGSSISTYYIHRVYESHSRVLEENVSTIRAAWACRTRSGDCTRSSWNRATRNTARLASKPPSWNRRSTDTSRKPRKLFLPEERDAVHAARDHFAIYRDQIDTHLQPPGLGDLLGSRTAENEKTIRLARAVAEPCRQLIELNERMLAESSASTAKLSTWINFLRLAFLIAGRSWAWPWDGGLLADCIARFRKSASR